MKSYDILVIGSGPGGSSVAFGCNERGLKVGIVDSYFGGTCALRGCTPKKAMETVTSAYWQAKAFEKMGFPQLTSHVSWDSLIAHQSKFTEYVPIETRENFEDAGIDVIKGTAAFLNSDTIVVGDKKYKGKKIVIATGATPVQLDIPGGNFMITSDDFFNINKLPKRITIVGGGYIAFEFSHILAACGSEVTIVSDEEMPLGFVQDSIVKELLQSTFEKGITVKLGYKAVAIEKDSDGYAVRSEMDNGQNHETRCDLVINAAGRIPNIEELALDKAKVKVKDGAISVDDCLRTSTRGIYALGDVIGDQPFTEAANFEADIILKNIDAGRHTNKVDYTGMPLVVYTYPKIAKVGELGDDSRVNVINKEIELDTFFTQKTHAQSNSTGVMSYDKSSGKILGVQLIGQRVEEMINIFGFALQNEISVQEIKKTLLAYPTATHDVKHMF